MAEKQIDLGVRRILSADDQIQEKVKIIFSAIFFGALNSDNREEYRIYQKKKVVSESCLKTFRSRVKEDIFSETYALLTQLIIHSEAITGGLSVDKLLKKAEMDANQIIHSNAFPQLRAAADLSGNQMNDSELTRFLLQIIRADYEAISRRVVTLEAFQEALDDYIEEFKRLYLRQVSMITANILDTEGCIVVEGSHSTFLRGTQDALDYFNRCQNFLINFGKPGDVSGYVFNGDYLHDRRTKVQVEKNLFDTGIDEIDSLKGPVRRGQIVGILGPMKGGKTSFTMYLAARCLAKGLNVAIWTIDGTNTEWEEGILVSLLSNGYYKDYRCNISRTDVAKGAIPAGSNEEKSLAAIEQALANGEFGRLSFFSGISYVENIKKDLLTHYKQLNPFDVFILDTPLNMKTLNRNKTKVTALSDGITTLAQVLREELPTPAASIWTGQLKQETINYLRQHQGEEGVDLGITDAAESSEMIKTPDIIYGLYSDKDMRASHQLRITDIATRGAESVDTFVCGADLACLKYWSDPNLK